MTTEWEEDLTTDQEVTTDQSLDMITEGRGGSPDVPTASTTGLKTTTPYETSSNNGTTANVTANEPTHKGSSGKGIYETFLNSRAEITFPGRRKGGRS